MTTEQIKNGVKSKLDELSLAFDVNEQLKDYGNALLTGNSGVFLFRLYYLKYIEKNDEKLENELVEFISSEIQKPISSTTFCSGIAGFAWFLHHLRKQEMLDIGDELFVDFDEVVLEASKQHLLHNNHDYLHGALGQLIYVIERSVENENCREILKDLLDLLIGLGIESEDTIHWIESEDMLDEESKGNEVINLHLSHGQASKIMILAKMAQAGLEEAKPWCEKAVRFLLNNVNEDQEQALYPSSIVNGEKEAYAHLGWCRGNISIGIALVIAGDVLNDPEIRSKGIEMAKYATRLDTSEKAHIYDAAICHGFAGLSHMYMRLFRYTQVPEFETAANLWMQKTIEAAQFEDGIAGFKVRDGLTKQWVNDYGLLSGTSGIGLAMIAHLSEKNMDWDKCFLLN